MGRHKQVLSGRVSTPFQIGDRATGRQDHFMGKEPQYLTGEVSYIHPEGRFINIKGKYYTESFYSEDIQRGHNDAKLPAKAQ